MDKLITEFHHTLLQELKEGAKNNRIRLPENNLVILNEGNDIIKIELNAKAVGIGTGKPSNMQDIDACFESWALVIKAFYKPELNIKVKLDISSDIDITKTPDFGTIIALKPGDPGYDEAKNSKFGHWGRFLYRALRFSQQYSSWFILSPGLVQLTDRFNTFLNNYKDELKNNLPNGEAMTKGSIKDPNLLDEKCIEDMLAKKKALQNVINNEDIKLGDNSYRQFPVGLVHGEKKIFTGGSSAIDMWNIYDKEDSNDVLNIIELKYKNKMLGIITELFFYVNYIYDFVSPNHLLTLTKYNSFKNVNARGYKSIYKLAAGECDKINGIMLAEEYHPLINARVINVMNENSLSDRIHYYTERYDYEIRITRHK